MLGCRAATNFENLPMLKPTPRRKDRQMRQSLFWSPPSSTFNTKSDKNWSENGDWQASVGFFYTPPIVSCPFYLATLFSRAFWLSASISLSLAHILTHAHTQAHTHPQTRTQAHTHIHTHKHNLSLSPYSTCRFPITASISNLSHFVYLSTY